MLSSCVFDIIWELGKRASLTEKQLMARYLARACPRCNGYLGIVIREPGRNVPLQAVNGRCTRASFASFTDSIAERLLGS